eukprot:gb/GECG01016561.1/.p1 GENE.gb/GECG01016561.1/~~gb/GECG01016561.1/.p1  ORF type:complete len:135 (+),score=3.39 gb/GECG01016561.1/:1-405(+)
MLSCTWTDPRTRKPYSVDLTNGIDISTSIRPYEAEEEQANAFGLPAAKAQPVQLGNFVGSIEAGASVNCPVSPSSMPRIHYTVLVIVLRLSGDSNMCPRQWNSHGMCWSCGQKTHHTCRHPDHGREGFHSVYRA